MMPSWLAQWFAVLKPQIPKDFVGRVEVNCFKGSISNINVHQSFKEEERK